MTAPSPGESDASLAARALTGDRRAFDNLVIRYQEPLYRFIRRYVGDADETYDLLQETFVAAWQALGRYDPDRSALTWLRRIALNKCRDWGRRRTVRKFFYHAAPLEAAESATPDADLPADTQEAALARLQAHVEPVKLLRMRWPSAANDEKCSAMPSGPTKAFVRAGGLETLPLSKSPTVKDVPVVPKTNLSRSNPSSREAI